MASERGRGAPWLLAGLLCGLVACSSDPISLESFTILVQLKSDTAGVDLSGVPVSFGSQEKGRFVTDARGQRGVTYRGAVGSRLRVRVQLPPRLVSSQATDRQLLLATDAEGHPQPVRFVLNVRPAAQPAPAAEELRRYVLAAETGCAKQRILLDGELLGQTASDGYVELVFKRAPAKVQLLAEATERCPALSCEFELADKTIIPFDARCAKPAPAEAAAPEPAPAPEPTAAAREAPPPPKPEPAPRTKSRTARRAASKPAPKPRAAPKAAKAPAQVPQAALPKPVEPSGGVKGGRSVSVRCEPAGLSLYVDGKKTLDHCTPGAVVLMTPGVHKLQLEGPGCPRSRAAFTEVPAKGAVTEASVQTSCSRSCEERVRAALGAKQRLSEAQLACLKRPASDKSYLSAQLLRAHAYSTMGYNAKAEAVLAEAAATPSGKVNPELHLRLAAAQSKARKLKAALSSVDLARRYRANFRSKRRSWFIKISELRAGLLEQLFYRDRDRKRYQEAVREYESLLVLLKKANSRTKAKKVQANLKRLQNQARRLKGG